MKPFYSFLFYFWRQKSKLNCILGFLLILAERSGFLVAWFEGVVHRAHSCKSTVKLKGKR